MNTKCTKLSVAHYFLTSPLILVIRLVSLSCTLALWQLTVCSDKFIRTKLKPASLAIAATRLVFPPPGEPSSRIGLGNCKARITRRALIEVVRALKEKCTSSKERFVPTKMAFSVQEL